MKEKIYSSLINVAVLGIVLLMGFGTYSLYQDMQFKNEYQANILKMQRDQIKATCEQIILCEECDVEEPDGK